MTPKEALRILNETSVTLDSSCQTTAQEYHEMLHCAEDALNKQIPGKPKTKRTICIHSENGTFKSYFCPTCDEIVCKNRNEWSFPSSVERYCCK